MSIHRLSHLYPFYPTYNYPKSLFQDSSVQTYLLSATTSFTPDKTLESYCCVLQSPTRIRTDAIPYEGLIEIGRVGKEGDVTISQEATA
jgi:hypothetical protein